MAKITNEYQKLDDLIAEDLGTFSATTTYILHNKGAKSFLISYGIPDTPEKTKAVCNQGEEVYYKKGVDEVYLHTTGGTTSIGIRVEVA